ncbi:hypothetical protein Tco_1217663 [Tanacetum coccineum]
MYGPCSPWVNIPCGKHSLPRLQRRLQAATKVATEVASYYEGNCEGGNRGYWLLRRLPQRLQTVVEAATKVVGCCEGGNTVKKATMLLIRLLPHRVQAAVKAATKVASYYQGCHIGCRLLQRLHDAVTATIEVVGCCRGCHKGCRLLLQAVVKATIKVAGYCEGCHIGCKMLQRLHDLVKDATLLRGLKCIMIEVWKVIMKVMAEIMGGSYGDNAYLPGRDILIFRLRGGGASIGPLNSKGGAFERAFELRKGIYRLDSMSVLAEGRRLHPLGEYVITLYTNGKLRTRMTVMLISEAESTSSSST